MCFANHTEVAKISYRNKCLILDKGLLRSPGTELSDMGLQLKHLVENRKHFLTLEKWEKGRPAWGLDGDLTLISVPPSVEGKAARLEAYTGPNPEQNEQNSAQSWDHTDRKEVGRPESISLLHQQARSPGA